MADIYLIASSAASFSWTTTANWSGGVAPATGDNVFILSGQAILDTGISQTAIVLASLTISNAFTGSIGGSGSNALQIGVTTAYIGTPRRMDRAERAFRGAKSTREQRGNVLHLQFSLQSGESPLPPVCLKSSNTNSAVYAIGGVVGVGVLTPNESNSWATLDVGNGGRSTVGSSNVAYANIVNRGTCSTIAGQTNSAIANLAGTLTTSGQFAVGSLQCGGSTIIGHRAASGTSIGALTLQGGTADFSANPATVSVGQTSLMGGTLIVFNSAQANLGTLSVTWGIASRLSATLS